MDTLRNLEYFRLILLTFWDTTLKFRVDFEETEDYKLMNLRKLRKNNFTQISKKFWRNILEKVL